MTDTRSEARDKALAFLAGLVRDLDDSIAFWQGPTGRSLGDGDPWVVRVSPGLYLFRRDRGEHVRVDISRASILTAEGARSVADRVRGEPVRLVEALAVERDRVGELVEAVAAE